MTKDDPDPAAMADKPLARWYGLDGQRINEAQAEELLRSPEKRIYRRTKVGPSLVSTAFVVLDALFNTGEPLLWETMVFGAPEGYELWRKRDATLEEAAQTHTLVVNTLADFTGYEPRVIPWVNEL